MQAKARTLSYKINKSGDVTVTRANNTVYLKVAKRINL